MSMHQRGRDLNNSPSIHAQVRFQLRAKLCALKKMDILSLSCAFSETIKLDSIKPGEVTQFRGSQYLKGLSPLLNPFKYLVAGPGFEPGAFGL